MFFFASSHEEVSPWQRWTLWNKIFTDSKFKKPTQNPRKKRGSVTWNPALKLAEECPDFHQWNSHWDGPGWGFFNQGFIWRYRFFKKMVSMEIVTLWVKVVSYHILKKSAHVLPPIRSFLYIWYSYTGSRHVHTHTQNSKGKVLQVEGGSKTRFTINLLAPVVTYCWWLKSGDISSWGW